MNSREKIPGELKNLPKENPFTVPEGYFEGFRDRILEKTVHVKSTKGKLVPLWTSYKNIFSIAAGFILFAAISYALLHFIVGSNTEKLPNGKQYANYIEKEINSFDDDLLMSAYTGSSFKEIIEEPELSGESLVEYLILEDVELDLIINEF